LKNQPENFSLPQKKEKKKEKKEKLYDGGVGVSGVGK
jgi:hypothetical protein